MLHLCFNGLQFRYGSGKYLKQYNRFCSPNSSYVLFTTCLMLCELCFTFGTYQLQFSTTEFEITEKVVKGLFDAWYISENHQNLIKNVYSCYLCFMSYAKNGMLLTIVLLFHYSLSSVCYCGIELKFHILVVENSSTK